MPIPASAIAFYLIATLMVGSACIIAFSTNLVYAAFALLATLVGAAAMYILLNSDYLAATQIIVYIGGVAVLFLFAVMLTHNISKATTSNRHMGIKVAVPAGLVIIGLSLYAVLSHNWEVVEVRNTNPTTHDIGHAFLNEYLLPFEFTSVILLVVLIGAALVARREISARMSDEETPNV